MSLESEYRDRIAAAYQGEVYGEALFGTLAQRCERSERRRKWRILERLEVETKLRLRLVLERLGLQTDEDPAGVERGRQHGEGLAGRPWMDLMELFLREVEGHVARFEELERMAPPSDVSVLARVTAHEVALQSFARLELLGRGAESAGPALALLEREPELEMGQAAAS